MAKLIWPEKPKKAYVIVSGEYSDYTINAVFLNKEEAERAAEIANRKGGAWYDDHRVLEFDIGVPCDLEKFDLYSAYFDKDGHVTHASKHSLLFSDELNQSFNEEVKTMREYVSAKGRQQDSGVGILGPS